jgi:hypothetical protein
MASKLENAGFTENSSYEFFMLGVSLLSFLNLIIIFLPLGQEINDVVFMIDRVTAFLFMADFIRRLIIAKNKSHYFFRQYGWSDLIASIPVTAFNIFRVFRVLRFIRVSRLLGFRTLFDMLKKNLAETALYSVFFAILLVLQFGSIAILVTERASPESNIQTASDALWWVFVSITTVGYGDRFPVTDLGRLVGVVTLTLGVGLFGVVTGYIANAFLGKRD